MGAMQILQETYKKARNYVGRKDFMDCVLLPIAHSTQNAQVEIVINLKGEWKSARKVEKIEAVTIIPVTKDSGSRASGIAPHPLMDKLCYVAGDFYRYDQKKKAEEYYQAYLEQLEKWIRYGSHNYVTAIYSYIKKRTMVKDLINEGVLVAGEDGRLDETIKIEGINQNDAFIRFRIQDEMVLGLGEVWKEQAVYDDYINFYLKQFKEVDLDYITGEYMPCSDKHPSKIRYSGDKAKLISANDSTGFTYRGRFTNKNEALSIGYVSSQEAHNALRWLIERQGYKKYGMCVVTWNPEDEELPDYLKYDTIDTIYGAQINQTADFAESYAKEVNRAIKGCFANLNNPLKQVVVMALDGATPGRLSVIYYQQIQGSEFLNHLIHWHTSCCWIMSYKKAFPAQPMAPMPEDIVKAAYGVERNELLYVEDKLIKITIERLIPCIVYGKKIPRDIVKAAFENACRAQAFNNLNRRKILEIACALIYKDYQDRNKNKKGECNSMSLNRENHNRDYLYGRLLAVAHKLEYDTYTKEEQGKRITNAERYRNMMIKRPNKTWLDIYKKLHSYEKKLNRKLQVMYQKEFQEIYDSFQEGDYTKKEKLGELVLLGYHCQLSELWKMKRENEDGGQKNE
ncbi:type I-C CRISPR-associated protein Cas8c/Csd1 [Candidatus Galacturonibacter soehngenii]|uniref:Type I-C CRISPR-associated protein Cas8c/Csd1 n=1 Tax=Candidatus Galacturonatibacter soehngenii TaxID=2307010 RepID=A0A7V7QJN5_9FIRM|nr:type I-C CRISPR-associated protein Cas8c/Csd1 [Candidatus Galacturonibacter soehngenii]KAB1437879.1 type I-C CRISPR-associated protein Cas8c/Csd1 [Candidatus Galacturonibacter soehngenii]